MTLDKYFIEADRTVGHAFQSGYDNKEDACKAAKKLAENDRVAVVVYEAIATYKIEIVEKFMEH